MESRLLPVLLARRLPTSPRPRLNPAATGGGARAHAARFYPFLNFSIWTDEVEPYKLNQRLVKFQSGTNIKCPTTSKDKSVPQSFIDLLNVNDTP
jgi:hypothetical protein